MVNKKKAPIKIVVYEKIKKDILYNVLKPGDITSENQLVEYLGCSRTPIREAINMLSHEGLVKVYPQRGIVIPEISYEKIREIQETRECLETYSARKAALRINDENSLELKKVYEQLEEALAENDFDRYHKLDIMFHDQIIKISGNLFILELINNINDRMYHIRLINARLPDRMKIATTEHKLILSALLNKDPEASFNNMKNHLVNMREMVLDLLERDRINSGQLLGRSAYV